MKSRIGKVLAILFFIIGFTLFSETNESAAADKQRIYDEAEVLSESEVTELETIAREYSEKRETDFVIITVKDAAEDLQVYMDDFYDETAFGYDQPHGKTAMIGIDVGESRRDVVLSAYKGIEEELSSDRLDLIEQQVIPYLSDGDYFIAFESFIELSADYMNYRPGVNPENPFFQTWMQLLIALVIAALVVWFLARNVKPRMTTTSATYRDDERTKVLQRRDRYIRTTVTKRRKPKQSSSGGGRRGGGGGGIGRTSAGHSRSSSRGKF